MARFRARRWLLWGLLFLPVLAVPLAFVLGHAYINQRLQHDLTLGKYRLHLSAPRLGWDLRFTADSLRFTSPASAVRAGRVRGEARFWQSLVSLNPSFLVQADSVRVDLAGAPDSRQPRMLRLRREKPAVFPTLRIPVPFRLEADAITIGRTGRDGRPGRAMLRVTDAALYSQGPKGAALQWKGAVLYPEDSALALAGTVRASARWFGKWLRYQASFQGPSGDAVRLEGERRKADLRRGRDSLEASVAGFAAYEHLFGKARIPGVTGLRAAGSFSLDEALGISLDADFIFPAPKRIGPQEVSLRLAFRDTSGILRLGSQGEQGQTGLLQGSFHIPISDSVPLAALPTLIRGEFTGHTRNVRIPIARWILPGDVEIRKLSVAGGEAQAEVRTRDSSELQLRFFRDSVPRFPHLAVDLPPRAGRGPPAPGARLPPPGAGGKMSWRFTLTGQASPTETWARIWTRDQVNYRSAQLTGEFRPGELVVDVRGKQVTAYVAAADSLWARNVIRRRGYYLADSRLYWKNETWPIKGRVEWGERKASRGPRGLRLRREVSLTFGSEHARHGAFEFSMPRRGFLEIDADRLAAEHLFVPSLEKIRPYHPVLGGRFAWDWDWRTGDAGLHADVLAGGRRIGLDLEAGWDARRLRVARLEAGVDGSWLRLGAILRLGGGQFYQVRRLGFDDVESLVLEADRFQAAHLETLLPGRAPVSGAMDGRFAYSDSAGFRGRYAVRGLRFKPPADAVEVPVLTVTGQGRGLLIAGRTFSPKHPFLDDSLHLKVDDILGGNPGVSLRVASAGGLSLEFDGELPRLRSLRGTVTASGGMALPGAAGDVDRLRVRGRLDAPLDRDFLRRLRVDSALLEGRYMVQGLDTQTFRGEVGMRDGRVSIPSLTTADGQGRALTGEAEAYLGKPLRASARLRGQTLILKLQGLQKLMLQDVEASLHADSGGMAATARASKAFFQASRGALSARGDLENLQTTYSRRPTPAGGREEVPRLGVRARLRNFELKHKIGFRDMQRFFRTVKVEKRRKRIKPVDVNVAIEAVGAENRVETDILRMNFTGDLTMRGVYPYTMLSGEVNALSGQVGQTGQSYDIDDFGLRWQNATVEEGRINVEGSKRLKVDCQPETQRTCNVFVKLEGRLDEMNFSYDSDCGQTAGGEVIEPAALITSVSRGCYSGEYVSGAGDGGGYGEAMFTFLEPAISANLSRRVSKASAGWIQSTQVSGIGAVVAGDTTVDAEPISVSLETKEWKGLRGKAKAGYHPESKLPSPWENKVAVEWRVPLEKVAADSGWKRRVRNRITLEASAETRPEERLSGDEEQDTEVKAGLRYRFKFWRLW